MEPSVKVFEGIYLTLKINDDAHLADVRDYLEDALHGSYHSPAISNIKRTEDLIANPPPVVRGRTRNVPQPYRVGNEGLSLVIQFFRADDALKFKLVFGGKLVGVE